jgi:hypothetical protein
LHLRGVNISGEEINPKEGRLTNEREEKTRAYKMMTWRLKMTRIELILEYYIYSEGMKHSKGESSI